MVEEVKEYNTIMKSVENSVSYDKLKYVKKKLKYWKLFFLEQFEKDKNTFNSSGFDLWRRGGGEVRSNIYIKVVRYSSAKTFSSKTRTPPQELSGGTLGGEYDFSFFFLLGECTIVPLPQAVIVVWFFFLFSFLFTKEKTIY